MKKLKRKIIRYYNWLLFKRELRKTNTCKLAIMAANLFNETDKLLVDDMDYIHLEINPPLHGLHIMLLEAKRCRDEYVNLNKISPYRDTSPPQTINFNRWCILPEYMDNANFNAFQSYLYAKALILNILDMAEKRKQISYVERRCFKLLRSFIMLTEILGELHYS